MPKPEEVPKKTKKNKAAEVLGLEVSRILVFWYLLRFLQGFQEKYCQNLRRYQKNQSLEVKILPKPEEVPKKKQKTQSSRSLGAWRPVKLWFFVFFGTSSGFGKIFTSRLWFFWYLLRFWQNVQGKYCQNLRRYQKKQNS